MPVPVVSRLTRCSAALAVAAFALGAPEAFANPELPQPSPRARVEQRVGVTDIAVDYSSPGVKGRKIWGELVPYDEPWRTGANAATRLTVSHDFVFGGKKVPAGSYALYTIPGKKTWTVALNTSTDSWGTYGLDKKTDVVRISVKPEAAPMRERLMFSFDATTDDSTKLEMHWEKLRITVPISVDTKGMVLANIEKAVEDSWRPHFASARWLLESGGDLKKALEYIDASVAIKPTWWNNWVRAEILAKQGKSQDAVAAAENAQKLGKGERVYEQFYKDRIAAAITGWKKKS